MSLPNLKWGNENEKSDSTNYQLGTLEVCLDYSYFTFKKSVLATTLKRENSKE